MKAAIVQGAGQAPVYGDFADPEPAAGEAIITVAAAPLTHVTRARAAGTHYTGAGQFPFVAGMDGVGALADGSRVYFVMPRAPYGGMAERTVARPVQCVPIPDGLDDVTAAAIANPGVSSWAALTERGKLKAGETVLVNGATGIAGRLAVQIAKHLGAGKVIATGRSEEALRHVAELGADVTIPLGGDEAALDKAFEAQVADGVGVVIDYLWGKSAERMLAAAARTNPPAAPLRFVQVGSVTGADITLPSALLRSAAIELMGSGLGSVAPGRLTAAIASLFAAAPAAGFKIATRTVPLSDVTATWSADDSRRRIVFTVA